MDGGEVQLKENKEEGRRSVLCNQVAGHYTSLIEPHSFCFVMSLSFLSVHVRKSDSNWRLGGAHTYLANFSPRCACVHVCVYPCASAPLKHMFSPATGRICKQEQQQHW